MRANEGRNSWNLPATKTKASTAVGRGENAPLISGPGSELRLGRKNEKGNCQDNRKDEPEKKTRTTAYPGTNYAFEPKRHPNDLLLRYVLNGGEPHQSHHTAIGLGFLWANHFLPMGLLKSGTTGFGPIISVRLGFSSEEPPALGQSYLSDWASQVRNHPLWANHICLIGPLKRGTTRFGPIISVRLGFSCEEPPALGQSYLSDWASQVRNHRLWINHFRPIGLLKSGTTRFGPIISVRLGCSSEEPPALGQSFPPDWAAQVMNHRLKANHICPIGLLK